jgi:CDP-6-deoxy-D-xylo-4-hexulose-3-dehydrase
MKGRQYRVVGDLATANAITERSFWIGVYPGLSVEMLDYAADRIGEFLGVGF